MSTESERLLTRLRRVKQRLARAESAVMSQLALEHEIAKRRAARLKYVVGGDVVAGAGRGELAAKNTLAVAHGRARERDQPLFNGRVADAAKEPSSDDDATAKIGSG